MLMQLLLLCGLVWLFVIPKAFVLRQPHTTANPLAYHRPRSVGLLWLIQAIHLLLWAYHQMWWLVITITTLCALATFSPVFPRFARFTAVPYLAYPLSCCLLE